MCIKIVQEYERAVIFRLGRILTGGARGPGLFFIIPCIDNYTKVDLRTVSFDVPPQEVSTITYGRVYNSRSMRTHQYRNKYQKKRDELLT